MVQSTREKELNILERVQAVTHVPFPLHGREQKGIGCRVRSRAVFSGTINYNTTFLMSC